MLSGAAPLKSKNEDASTMARDQSRSAVCIWHCAPVVQVLVLARLGNVRNEEVPRHLRAVYRRGVGVFRASESSDCFLNMFDLLASSVSLARFLGMCGSM